MKHQRLVVLLLSLLLGTLLSPGSLNALSRRIPSSSYNVQINPSVLATGDTAIDIGPNLWSVQGYDLRGLLARVYDIDPARIDLGAAPVAAERFDVSLPLAGDESDEAVQHILAAALASRFHLAVSLERHSVDVYVLTAPHGAAKGMHPVLTSPRTARSGGIELADYMPRDAADTPVDFSQAEVITVSGMVCPTTFSAGITAHSSSVGSFARTLEDELKRPVLDETHIGGLYDFKIPEYHTQQELFALIHEKLGLAISSQRRDVAILTIHSMPQGTVIPMQTALLHPPALAQ